MRHFPLPKIIYVDRTYRLI